MPQTIKGVFFDLLGTLLIYGDMEKAWQDWLEVFFAGLKEDGLIVLPEEFARKCDGFFGREVNGKAGDGLTVYEQRIA
ncbi:MAG: hypothetical protein GY841_13060, partial [FCB group bacterium]|nr:hypothetical protein [FCB group bacterium]